LKRGQPLKADSIHTPSRCFDSTLPSGAVVSAKVEKRVSADQGRVDAHAFELARHDATVSIRIGDGSA